MSTLKDGAIKAVENSIPQCLGGLKGQVETFEVWALGLADHPISGLATEFAKFHEVLVKAEAAHAEYLAKMYGPPKLDEPVAADANADDEVKVDIPPAVQ